MSACWMRRSKSSIREYGSFCRFASSSGRGRYDYKSKLSELRHKTEPPGRRRRLLHELREPVVRWAFETLASLVFIMFWILSVIVVVAYILTLLLPPINSAASWIVEVL